MDEKKDGNFIEENEKEKTEMTADETPETRDAGKTADNGDRSGAAAEDDGADAGQTAENTETAAEAAETAAGAAKKAEDTETAADTGTAENAESVSGEGADLSAEEADDASAEEEAGTAADVSSGTYAEAASDVPYYEPADSPVYGPADGAFGQEAAMPAKTPLFKNKKILIAVIIIAAAIVAAIVIVNVVRGSVFDRMTDQILEQYPYANNARAADGSYLKLDTNPYDKGFDDMSYVEMSAISSIQSDTLDAIQFVNKELGFTDALYSKMMETSALMGRQTDENDKYRVSWTYHPDSGLEVVYEIK